MTTIFRTLSLTQTATTYAQLVNELREGELNLDAPYQRGHVWDEARQVALIKSLTMGLPTAAIYINERDLMEARVIIDGKQRISAVRRWMDNDLAVPSSWFPHFNQARPDVEPTQILEDPDNPLVSYEELTRAGRNIWKNSASVAVYWSNFSGPKAVDREAELFGLINFGGLAQGAADTAAWQPGGQS